MPEKSVFLLKAIAEKAIGGFSDPSRKPLVTYCSEKNLKTKIVNFLLKSGTVI